MKTEPELYEEWCASGRDPEKFPHRARTKTVTVACRVPNGLEIRLCAQSLNDIPGMKIMVPQGRSVRLAGPNTPGAEVAGDFGLTRGVDAVFMASWLEQNADSPLAAGSVHTAPEE